MTGLTALPRVPHTYPLIRSDNNLQLQLPPAPSPDTTRTAPHGGRSRPHEPEGRAAPQCAGRRTSLSTRQGRLRCLHPHACVRERSRAGGRARGPHSTHTPSLVPHHTGAGAGSGAGSGELFPSRTRITSMCLGRGSGVASPIFIGPFVTWPRQSAPRGRLCPALLGERRAAACPVHAVCV